MRDKIKNDLIATYDKYARDRYQAKHAQWKDGERAKFLGLLIENECRLILDLGAGPARDSLIFRDNGFDVICIDLSLEMTKICRENGLDAAVMDIENTGFAENSVDAVWAMNSLLHIPKGRIDGVLIEIERILRPGSLFYVGMYGGRDFEGISEDDFYTPKRFFSYYTDERLKEVIAKHFEIMDFTNIPQAGRTTDFHSAVARKT